MQREDIKPTHQGWETLKHQERNPHSSRYVKELGLYTCATHAMDYPSQTPIPQSPTWPGQIKPLVLLRTRFEAVFDLSFNELAHPVT